MHGRVTDDATNVHNPLFTENIVPPISEGAGEATFVKSGE